VRVISNHHFDLTLWQMCCPGPSVPLQSQVWQKHCVLVAASNPHRLPTPVVRPPVTARMQTSATGEPQAEQWWLADAETVAKAFPLCQVSLSIIAPRQLPLLRQVYNGAKRNPRVLESVSDASKLYPHHLVLLSEGFMEGRMALRSAVVTSNVVAPPGVSAKLEQTIPTTSQAPAISGRSSSVNTSKITIVALFMLCMLRIFVGILFGLLQQYPKLC
jgi:mediator of RNA polymerase II transcription subunit 25